MSTLQGMPLMHMPLTLDDRTLPDSIPAHFTHDEAIKIWWDRFIKHFPNDKFNISGIEFYPNDPNGNGEDVIVHYNNRDVFNFHIDKMSGYAELGPVRK